MLGGYQILDFKNVNLTTTEVSISPSLYEVIEANNKKPLLLTNLVINDSQYYNCFAACSVSGSDYILDFGVPNIRISVKENGVSLISN